MVLICRKQRVRRFGAVFSGLVGSILRQHGVNGRHASLRAGGASASIPTGPNLK